MIGRPLVSRRERFALFAALVMLASPLAAARDAVAGTIAVVYPVLGEPFGTVFGQIVDGIEQAAPQPVTRVELNAQAGADTLARALDGSDARAIIALGRHGLEAAGTLERRLPVVGGAVLASPEDPPVADAVVSLAPDPALLLKQLRLLTPAVRRVFVVYSPHQNGWLIELARRAARSLDIELVATPAEDLRSALRSFQGIAAEARSGSDAIWLPQDSGVLDPEVVLPYVLQQAWDRSLVLFSSTLGHVQRGALFSLYPDNQRMGGRLASAALALALARVPPDAPRVEPLRELQAAINVRTAGHLGLDVSAVVGNYALVFPVR